MKIEIDFTAIKNKLANFKITTLIMIGCWISVNVGAYSLMPTSWYLIGGGVVNCGVAALVMDIWQI